MSIVRTYSVTDKSPSFAKPDVVFNHLKKIAKNKNSIVAGADADACVDNCAEVAARCLAPDKQLRFVTADKSVQVRTDYIAFEKDTRGKGKNTNSNIENLSKALWEKKFIAAVEYAIRHKRASPHERHLRALELHPDWEDEAVAVGAARLRSAQARSDVEAAVRRGVAREEAEEAARRDEKYDRWRPRTPRELDLIDGLFPYRVWLQCSSLRQMRRMKRLLKRLKYWSETGCRVYSGSSTAAQKAELQTTQVSWCPVFLVICNTAVSVSVNIGNRFGVVFQMTSAVQNTALQRDTNQGTFRTWRCFYLYPLTIGFANGELSNNALIDDSPPEFVNDDVTARTNRADNRNIGLLSTSRIGRPSRTDLRGSVAPSDLHLLMRNHFKTIEYNRVVGMRRDAALAAHGNAWNLFETSEMTIQLIAANNTERYADTRHHLARHLQLVLHPTRSMIVRRIGSESYLHKFENINVDEEITDSFLESVEEGDEEEEEDEEEDANAQGIYDVEASDQILTAHICDDTESYEWFINDFREFFVNPPDDTEHFPMSNASFTAQFLMLGDDFDNIRRRNHNGTTSQQLQGIRSQFRKIGTLCKYLQKPSVPGEVPDPRSTNLACAYSMLKRDAPAIYRRVLVRTLTLEKIRSLPVFAQPGMLAGNNSIIDRVSQILAVVGLELKDVLGFDLNQGFPDDYVVPNMGELLEVKNRCIDDLDVTFRNLEDGASGQATGRWGTLINLHEDLQAAGSSESLFKKKLGTSHPAVKVSIATVTLAHTHSHTHSHTLIFAVHVTRLSVVHRPQQNLELLERTEIQQQVAHPWQFEYYTQSRIQRELARENCGDWKTLRHTRGHQNRTSGNLCHRPRRKPRPALANTAQARCTLSKFDSQRRGRGGWQRRCVGSRVRLQPKTRRV